MLIVAHGNSLRALVKHLNGISDDEIKDLNIPTGVPYVFELDGQLKSQKHYYLSQILSGIMFYLICSTTIATSLFSNSFSIRS